MHQQETPPQCAIGPQAFKDILYGDLETGWLTIFYIPSRRTLWFPVSDPVPTSTLSRIATWAWAFGDSVPTTAADAAGPTASLASPDCGSTSTTRAQAPTRRTTRCPRPKRQPYPCLVRHHTSRPS